MTIGPNITVHGRSLTIGNIRGTDYFDYPYIENQGTILTEPGDSLSLSPYSFTNSGVIRIAGTNVATTYFNFTQTPSGKLEFDLAGTAPGATHGQLKIGGLAALQGVLQANLIAPYILYAAIG